MNLFSRQNGVLFSTILITGAMAGAEPEDAENKEAPVVMAPVKVVGAKPERFTIASWTNPDGSFRLNVRPMPPKNDFLCVMVGGVWPGDEIVSINGKPVAQMKKSEWSRELYGDFTLVVRRRVGRRDWKYFETEGRRGPS